MPGLLFVCGEVIQLMSSLEASILMEHVSPSLRYKFEDDFEFYIRSGVGLIILIKCGFMFLPLVCVLVCSLFVLFVFWFYISCDISIRLCICVFDMPII